MVGAHLPSVREDGFRLALPVPAPDDRWVIDGWSAQTWVAGGHPSEPRWLEVLDVSARLHAAMRHLPRPPFLDARTHEWAIGDRVAWGEMAPPVRHEFLDRLLETRRPVELLPQVIHGDLTENVLFDDALPPAVIDPAVYWRPAGYASAIVVGAMLDGIPESVAIGVSLLGGQGVGVAVVAAGFLSNVPESLSAATGLKAAGHSTRWIMGLWLGVAVVSALAAGVGYAVLGGASENVIAIIQAFAGGAILTMLADTMMPEAFEEGGNLVGLVTVLGFALAFVLSTA